MTSLSSSVLREARRRFKFQIFNPPVEPAHRVVVRLVLARVPTTARRVARAKTRLSRTALTSSDIAFHLSDIARAISAIDGFSTPLAMSSRLTSSRLALEYAM